MLTQLHVENITGHAKEIFEDYVAKKLPRLEKLLSPHQYDDDGVQFIIHARYVVKHNAYLLSLQLKIPHKSFHVDEGKHLINESLDLAFDNLIAQVRTYFQTQKDVHVRQKKAAKQKVQSEE